MRLRRPSLEDGKAGRWVKFEREPGQFHLGHDGLCFIDCEGREGGSCHRSREFPRPVESVPKFWRIADISTAEDPGDGKMKGLRFVNRSCRGSAASGLRARQKWGRSILPVVEQMLLSGVQDLAQPRPEERCATHHPRSCFRAPCGAGQQLRRRSRLAGWSFSMIGTDPSVSAKSLG